VAKNYQTKGEYITVDGLKTCITSRLPLIDRGLIDPSDATGDKSATHGIFVVYDIFGFFPQTLQGADILANGDHERPYRVFMPDLFEGQPADISWYPPDTKEKGEKLGKFFSTVAAPPKNVERVSKVMDALSKDNPGIKNWVCSWKMIQDTILTNNAGSCWILLGRKGMKGEAVKLR
jgi:hypothetical protein